MLHSMALLAKRRTITVIITYYYYSHEQIAGEDTAKRQSRVFFLRHDYI